MSAPQPQSSGTAQRRLRSVLFLTLLNDRLARFMVMPLLPYLLLRFHSSGVVMGLLLSSYTIIALFITPVAGHLSDVLGRRPILLGSLGLGVSGMTIFGFAPTLPLMFAGRLLDGLGGASATIAASVISDVTPPSRHTKAFGLIAIATAVSLVIGPGLGGSLATLGLRVPVLLACLTLLLNLVLAAIDLPETHTPVPRGQGSGTLSFHAVAMGSLQGLRPFAAPRLAGFSLAFGLVSMVGYGLMGIVSLYVAKVLHWSPGQCGLAFAAAGAAAVVQQVLLVGPLSRRYGHPALLLLSHGYGIAGCFCLLVSAGGAALGLTAGLALLSMALGLSAPCFRALVAARSGSHATGSGMGGVDSILSLGSCLGPPLVGWLYDRFSPRASFASMVVVLLVSMVVLLVANGRSRFRLT